MWGINMFKSGMLALKQIVWRQDVSQPDRPCDFEAFVCKQTKDSDIYIWTNGDQVEVPSGEIVTLEDC